MLIQGWRVSLNVLRGESQWGESQTGNEVREGVLPRCFCWRRSSPQQETAPMRFSLWRWAESKKEILIHLLRKRLRICRNEKSGDALTPTILFMASSLSDSLLLSNISLRSSFLWIDNTVTDARCGQYGERKPERDGLDNQLLLCQNRLGRLHVCRICGGVTDKRDESGSRLTLKPKRLKQKTSKTPPRLHFCQTCPVLTWQHKSFH